MIISMVPEPRKRCKFATLGAFRCKAAPLPRDWLDSTPPQGIRMYIVAKTRRNERARG
jgi:hypothetical protein